MRATRLQILVPLVYLLGAIIVWIDFMRLPPDGLANVAIGLYTFPIMLLAGAFTERSFPYVSSSLGYYQAHTVYFLISTLIIAAFLFLLVFWIQVSMRKKGK